MKPGWKTSEFWMMAVAMAAKAVVPDLPDEVLYGAMTYVAGRTAQKAAAPKTPAIDLRTTSED